MFSVSGALVTGSSNGGDDSVTAGCSVVRLRQRVTKGFDIEAVMAERTVAGIAFSSLLTGILK
jgi:hypothetical protein